MDTFGPLPEDAIRALTAEVAQRIRRGESRSAVRTELVADGLPAGFVDGLLAGIAEPDRRSVTSAAALVLSVAAFAVLPVAGAVAGAWAAWPQPPEEACGLWVFPALLVAGCAGLAGLAAGVGLAFAVLWGLSELSARVCPDAEPAA